MVSGPAAIGFSAPAALSTNAFFSTAGTYVLRLTASDSLLAGTSDVTITVNPFVNQAPQLPALPDRTMNLGETLTFELSANDPNVLDTLTYSLPVAPAGAQLSPAGSPRFGFTPTSAQLGSNTVTVHVQDQGGLFSEATFRITVLPADRPPSLDPQPDARVAAGAAFLRTLTATDPDSGDTLTFALVSGPAGMTLAGGNQLNWTPTPAQLGPSFATVKVTDSAGKSDSKRFALTVFSAAPPVARDDSYQISLGQTLTVLAPGVLGNDVDPEGGALTASRLTNPDKGAVTAFNADGGFVYQAPASLPPPAWSFTQKFIGRPGATADKMPLIIDLNGDGFPDVIGNNIGLNYEMFAVSGKDGSILWDRTTNTEPTSDCSVQGRWGWAAGDIDDSDRPSVVFPVTCGRDSPRGVGGDTQARYMALNFDGSFKWLSPTLGITLPGDLQPPSNAINTWPTISRLAANGPPRILFGFDTTDCSRAIAGSSGTCRAVYALSGQDGSIAQTFKADPPPFFGTFDFGALGFTAPIVADLDGDGQYEVIYAGAIFNSDGTLRWQQTQASVEWVGIANFDDSPDIEIATLEYVPQTATPHRLVVRKADGTPLWFQGIPETTVYGEPAIGDTDGDGKPNIVLNVERNLWVFNHKGELQIAKNLGVYPNGQRRVDQKTRFAVFDVNGDGIPEILFSQTDKLTLLRGDNGEVEAEYVYATPGDYNPTQFVAIADIDNDGHADIVIQRSPVCDFVSCSGGGIEVVSATANDWQPAGKQFNQRAWFPGAFEDSGKPALTFNNVFATPQTNVFASPPRLGVPIDPRKSTRTSFTYSASSGGLSSVPATVSIDIHPQNSPPKFVSIPPKFYVPQSQSYTARAIDPDPADSVTYALIFQSGSNNGNASIDPVSGVMAMGSLFAGDQVFIITATDSQGAVSFQEITMRQAAGYAAVPDVIGQTQAAAASLLTAALLSVGNVTQQYDSSPAGTVLAQAPIAGVSLPQGESVNLTVSQGPAPAFAPDVVGRTLAAAGSILGAAGFSAGTVTYQYDTTRPRGTVLAQTPPAGTLLVPGPLALTVSAGTGLELRLSRSFTTADVPITFAAVAMDLNGNESPAPPLNYAIVATATPFLGSLPTRSGTTLSFDPATRGAFRLTGTDPVSGRSASADFAVAQPRVAGQSSQMEQFARLTDVFEGLDALSRQAAAALAANDDAAMRARLTDMVNLWRTIDIETLKMASPFSPDAGFPPSVDDMADFGVTPGPDDAVNKQLLVQTEADLQAWIDGLNTNGTSLAQLNALAATFADDAGRLSSLSPGEYGVVDAEPDYALALGHRIPDLMETTMNQLGQVVGLPPRTSPFAGLALRSSPGTARTSSTLQVQETLPELLVSMAVNYIIDKINPAKKYTTDVLHQAAYGMAVVAASSHLKAYVQQTPDKDPVVISGASLSFRVFKAPFSMIEGIGLEKKYPDLNTVILIGPDLFNSVQALIQKIKDSTTLANGYKNMDEAYADFDKIKASLEAVLGGAQGVVDQAKKAFQSTKLADKPCLFIGDPTCVQLFYPDGFNSVYTYSPPEGFGGFTGLPLPIVFIIKNNVNGQVLIDTPPFFPTPP
jgi:hypothetical protein